MSMLNLTTRSALRSLCPPALWNAASRALTSSIPAEESELSRLRKLPRNTATVAHLLGRELQVSDGPSFAGIYETYFQRQEYQFPVQGESPLIIDGGANAGLSVLYWKQLSPNARVLAFEPDPQAFTALVGNCGGVPGITLKDSALWINTGRIAFSAVGSDGGHIAGLTERGDSPKAIQIPCVRLRDFLVEPVELLKLDIEGAEIEVLQDCADRLSLVKWLFVEYHSFVNKPQRLGEFLQTIENAGFRIYCRKERGAKRPFISRPIYNSKDFHLEIFAFRTA